MSDKRFPTYEQLQQGWMQMKAERDREAEKHNTACAMLKDAYDELSRLRTRLENRVNLCVCKYSSMSRAECATCAADREALAEAEPYKANKPSQSALESIPVEMPAEPAQETMRILYESYGRCLWHEDCDKSRCGIMSEVRREETRTLLRCLHCGREGYFPVGTVSACVPVERSQPDSENDEHR